MDTRGDAVKAGRVGDAIPQIPPPENAARRVSTGWRAGLVWLAGCINNANDAGNICG